MTVTCNPEWPEIASVLYPGQAFHDHPMSVARVFRQKLKDIMTAIVKMFPHAGLFLFVLYFIFCLCCPDRKGPLQDVRDRISKERSSPCAYPYQV